MTRRASRGKGEDPVPLWPVYEFRPLDRWMRGDVFRYAEGQWLKDDGEYDLAFVMRNEQTCYGVDLPYRRNILWSWTTRGWQYNEPLHPDGNPWHYQLREGTKDWHDIWPRERHANRVAFERASDWLVSQRCCANGHFVEFRANDPVIAAGLLRRVDTKEIVHVPERLVCMYCGTAWTECRHVETRVCHQPRGHDGPCRFESAAKPGERSEPR